MRTHVARLLPASSFAKDVDHVTQTLGALEPIQLQPGFRAVRITFQDGLDDGVVLLHRDVKVFDDGACIETPVPFRLGFDGLVKRRHAGAGTVFDDEPMKVAIKLEDLAGVAVMILRDEEKTIIEGLQLRADLLTLGEGKQSDSAAGDAFQMPDDAVELVGVFLRQGSDDHAGFLDVAMFEDVPLALKPMDRTADRGAAHIEPFGQFGLKDPGSGGEASVDDEFANFAKRRKETRTVFGLDSRGGHCRSGPCFLHLTHHNRFQ